MGQIVGAAIVSHHPGLMQCEEFRVMQGNGADCRYRDGTAFSAVAPGERPAC